MPESIVDVSHRFFDDIVKPILAEHFPDELAVAAIGVFGHGSEALRMDDAYSSDHHWGLRIDALFPHDIFVARGAEMREQVSALLPPSYEGHSLRAAHVAGAGLAPESLQHFLVRTIGIDHAPRSYVEWLQIPEEDVIHVINGEVWHDPTGEFSGVRTVLNGYYPEPVRLRRIAHWCRYFSGMGAYALKRAILRDNDYYANITFTRAIRLGVQLAFLLEKQYFPYDKWTYAYFTLLPRLAAPCNRWWMKRSSWPRRGNASSNCSTPSPTCSTTSWCVTVSLRPTRATPSPTSGYRVLEHAYAEIIHNLPADLKPVVPIWDQIHFESFHSEFVDRIDLDTWDEMLQLNPKEEQ
ncbi:MAG: DUF4037 domain-containing protein [Caldilineaceae bacterium]